MSFINGVGSKVGNAVGDVVGAKIIDIATKRQMTIPTGNYENFSLEQKRLMLEYKIRKLEMMKLNQKPFFSPTDVKTFLCWVGGGILLGIGLCVIFDR